MRVEKPSAKMPRLSAFPFHWLNRMLFIMKTLQLSLLKPFTRGVLVAAFMSISQAAVTITWDASPDAATPGAVAGYHVYYGSLNFASVPVGNQTTTVLNNLLAGKM